MLVGSDRLGDGKAISGRCGKICKSGTGANVEGTVNGQVASAEQDAAVDLPVHAGLGSPGFWPFLYSESFTRCSVPEYCKVLGVALGMSAVSDTLL